MERNQAAAEALQNTYTYHVHFEGQQLDSKGSVKKASSTDSESLTIDGVRVDRDVARNGKPLTADEARKENERIDKTVAKERENRKKHGDQKDDPDDVVLSASRILELGSFSNPRRIDLDGRPTLVVDYAGSPDAKTRNRFEAVVRDLVGTAWIDDQDRVLVRAQGHFLHDFKIGGGLVADVKSGTSFEVTYVKVNNEAWLPRTVDGQGRIRILLVTGFNGRIHLVTSDYKKFRTSTTIIQSDRVIGPDGQPVSPQTEPPSPRAQPVSPGAQPAAPGTAPPSPTNPSSRPAPN